MAVSRVLDGQQDVHVHVSTAVAEQVHEDRVVLKVHVEDQFEDLLAEHLHFAALPEEAVYWGSVADCYQAGKGIESGLV